MNYGMLLNLFFHFPFFFFFLVWYILYMYVVIHKPLKRKYLQFYHDPSLANQQFKSKICSYSFNGNERMINYFEHTKNENFVRADVLIFLCKLSAFWTKWSIREGNANSLHNRCSLVTFRVVVSESWILSHM